MGEQLFERPPPAEQSWLLRALRGEAIGGVLLLIGALLALLWANSPWGDAYATLVAWTIGPEALHLNLSAVFPGRSSPRHGRGPPPFPASGCQPRG